ncbi:MAG: arsenate reductase ArsC [Gammaproteobacteria bacterium]|nr:arsenate reductase ArsC [Gammaproteobacteria bacterium]
MTNQRTYNILFLCTGNSARSILAEAILNSLTQEFDGRRVPLKGYSAGSHPKGQVHPMALEILNKYSLSTAGLHSKSWDEFAGQDAPNMNFVITVCDSAAAEVCPVWPGQPVDAHWGLPDPAAATGTMDEQMSAFEEAFQTLKTRIELFADLPIEMFNRLKLQRKLSRIGKALPPDSSA